MREQRNVLDTTKAQIDKDNEGVIGKRKNIKWEIKFLSYWLQRKFRGNIPQISSRQFRKIGKQRKNKQ